MAVNVTLPEPSKDTLPVKSPASPMSLAFVNALAVLATLEDAEAVIPLDKMGGMGTNVVVNVAGSVISEGELQSVIQDALYNLNRSGAVTQLTNLGR